MCGCLLGEDKRAGEGHATVTDEDAVKAQVGSGIALDTGKLQDSVEALDIDEAQGSDIAIGAGKALHSVNSSNDSSLRDGVLKRKKKIK